MRLYSGSGFTRSVQCPDGLERPFFAILLVSKLPGGHLQVAQAYFFDLSGSEFSVSLPDLGWRQTETRTWERPERWGDNLANDKI